MAKLLVEASDNAGNEASLREGYSGRGMYGKETCGVVVDSQVQLMADLIQYMGEHIEQGDGFKEYTGMAIPSPENFRIDNMGRGVIIY